MYTDIVVNKFDVGERLKLVEAIVQNEVKGGKKDRKGVNSVNTSCSDFFYGAGHIALVADKDYKEGSDLVFDVAAEHVNNLNIVLNSRTANDVKVAETIQNVIFFLIGIHSIQSYTATARHGVTRKRSTKRLRKSL